MAKVDVEKLIEEAARKAWDVGDLTGGDMEAVLCSTEIAEQLDEQARDPSPQILRYRDGANAFGDGETVKIFRCAYGVFRVLRSPDLEADEIMLVRKLREEKDA